MLAVCHRQAKSSDSGSGSGKSTLGASLAKWQGCPFLDADAFHPRANLEKMKRPRYIGLGAREKKRLRRVSPMIKRSTCRPMRSSKRVRRSLLRGQQRRPSPPAMLQGFCKMSGRAMC
ncbi:MAG: hypothetical protein JOY96_11840 [Verrucomicrobia bacterium]|nr:hypothetical protein [Verrucomicrobiota bacterium]